MAEQRRCPRIPVATPNIGGPIAAARQQNASTNSNSNSGTGVPSESTLLAAVGSRIRITTSSIPSLEGVLFAVDTRTNLLAISQPSSKESVPQQPQQRALDFHLLSISKVTRFETLNASPTSAAAATGDEKKASTLPKLRPVEAGAQKERVRRAVLAEKKAREKIGKGVSREGQEIFDALDRQLPLRWHNKTIVVLDSVMIEAPYQVENCRAPEKNAQQLARVKKMLEFERKKLGEKKLERKVTSKESVNSIPNELRKGG